MRALIDKLLGVNVSEATEYSDMAQKYGFGTAEWQEAMINMIRRKLENNEEITITDRAFIDTQIEHNARLKDELEAMGWPGGRPSVN